MNKLLVLIASVSLYVSSQAQNEYFYINSHNDTIIQTRKATGLKSGIETSAPLAKPILSLPFFDDFARPGIFPTSQLWVNDNVYINNTFAIHPPTLGVATFDALNRNGVLYEGASSSVFGADTLTSLPIDLKNYQPADSVTLSFYLQPGGKGDMPESMDSIHLEFYAPSSRSGLMINEIQRDWVEIYNATSSPVNIGGYYLFNDPIAKIETKKSIIDTMRNATFDDFKIVGSSTMIQPYCFALIPATSIKGIKTFNSRVFMLYDTSKIRVDSIYVADTTLLIHSSFGRLTDGDSLFSSKSVSIIPSPGRENSRWIRAWGASSSTNSDKTIFKQHKVVVGSSFLKKGFRFRFMNDASLSSDKSHARNEDQWNIDNVYLDAMNGKAANYPDASLAYVDYSFIDTYSAIPYKHVSGLSENGMFVINYSLRNFDANLRKLKYGMSIKERSSANRYAVSLLEYDVPGNYSYNESLDFSDKLSLYNEFVKDSSRKKYADFDIQFYYSDASTNSQTFRWNDTARMRQIFYNYYAYDDGSSEAGWGVRGTEFAQVAYKYTTLKEDVLKSILLYCNNTLIADIPTFSLCVWADNNGKPGELLLKQPGMRTYYDKGINGFSLYRLDTSYIIKNKSLKFNGSFFIGWEQPKDFLMNIGVDMNKTLSKKTLFYKTNMVWTESLIENPIMIRPVFDNNTEVYNTIQTPSKNEATVYPNPASRAVSIVLPSGVNPENVTITISNATGYVAYRGTFTPEIGLENLLPGVYFISITDNTTIFDTRKLVINSSY